MRADSFHYRIVQLGVFFPPNPGAPATIGGMISNNSSGSRAVKYGVTRDYVKQLEVVLADGTITKLGTRATKTSSGFDLLDVVVEFDVVEEVVVGLALDDENHPPPAAAAAEIAGEDSTTSN